MQYFYHSRRTRGIFTWIPEDPLLEIQHALFLPGKKFEEITITLILTSISDSGRSGVVITVDPETKEELNMRKEGSCIRIPKGARMPFMPSQRLPVFPCFQSLGTSVIPIVHEELIPFGEEYKKYAEQSGFKHSIEELKKKNK